MSTSKEELKVHALLEKIGHLTMSYENQLADARVEITMLSSQLEESQKESADVPSPDDSGSDDAN